MSSAIYILVQIIIVMTLLIGMVMLLMGIHHFFRGENSEEEAADIESLRHEVEEQQEVMSDHNLFRRFLVRDVRRACHPESAKRSTAIRKS